MALFLYFSDLYCIMRNYINQLKLFDYVIIIFCLLTGIYITLGYNKLENIGIHILIRVLFISIVFLLILLQKSNLKFLYFLRNFYPLLFLGFLYSETDYYNNLLFENFDPFLVHIEELIFKTQPSLEFSKKIPYKWFSELMHLGYFSYYLITFGVPFSIYIKNRESFNKSMFIIILSFCFYYLTFVIFPSIGPQFFFTQSLNKLPDGYLFHKIMNIIIKIGETETGAFPSSHVGMAVIFLILTWKNIRLYFRALMILSFVLLLSTVYIHAHYVIDIIAGLISGFIFYLISNHIYLKLNQSKQIV